MQKSDLTEEHLEIIKKNPFFKQLDEELCEKLIERGTVKDIASGDYLIKQGETGSSMYLILEGLFIAYAANDKGEIQKIAELSASQIVGEIALLTDDLRAATIQAKTSSKVLEITRRNFFEILGNSHKAIHHLYSQSLNRLRDNFSTWFIKAGKVPSFWRQTAIIIMAIFPVVVAINYMISPFLSYLHIYTGISLFISVAISIFITSAIVIPAVMDYFEWWLFPKQPESKTNLIRDIAFILAVYLLEIVVSAILYAFMPPV